MSEHNRQKFPSFLALCALAIILPAILFSAGCVSPAPENTTVAVPSGCSSDAGVCPVVITPSIRINASPQTYTPLMSSTIGIGLTPVVTGFAMADAEFIWNASYGQFFDWSPPVYAVSKLPPPVVNHGEKIYWSFADSPASVSDPVIISVTARDPRSGKILGSSHLTLVWVDNLTVSMQKTP
jgi:hypothetical protein